MSIIVRNGIDNISEIDDILKNKRIGLITNPTGVNKNLEPTIDIINRNYNLCCLYSPEHGVRGNIQAGAKVESYIDEETNKPVKSLYGKNKNLTPDMLEDIDIMIFDIQDVGARFYTYLYTMTYAMEGCKKKGIPFIVLDRINPLGGKKTEGTLLDERFQSFVGKYSIPTRYGLTIGEFAKLINVEKDIGCNLIVVPCSGWKRDSYYDETDLLWIMPSPNIPTIESALIYIGTCVFEGTNLSEGRGTTKPFEIIGAPWLDTKKIIEIMEKKNLNGVKFRQTYFRPTFSKYKDVDCYGIQIHITDRKSFEPFKTGLYMLDEIRRNCSGFQWLKPFKEGGHHFIDLLLGTNEVRDINFDMKQFLYKQGERVSEFKKVMDNYYIYE
ncbi:hypothetical protein SH1V18_22160 [Vallitalea longa]|uniref:DUF1343 domain-containing protein n=1 Tax=Vallitalea longa TaxID=2936439 RepID=A0A9W5YBQ2_9FIRM|nr:DUF1343 domain-containing protein [Vallitalea longa]GKX29736.1 hypothetical protein SH1V18_22160 [Vallitalea longa]